VLEQDGARTPVFSLPAARIEADAAADGSLILQRPVGKKALPALKAGKAQFIATSSRKVLFGKREVSSEASLRVEVPADAAAGRRRLDAPLRQPRRLRDGRLPRHAGRRRIRASASAT
jgi:hypothetical protein